jgi:predicted ATPase
MLAWVRFNAVRTVIMLSLLQIRNFTIIESLDLELGRGFTAITGETGAGKSILVDYCWEVVRIAAAFAAVVIRRN